MMHTRLQEAMGHPDYISTFRAELKRIYAQGESATLDSLTMRGLFLYGHDDRLIAEINAAAEERSELTAEEQQYLLRLAYIAMGKMTWDQRWAV